LIIGPKPYKVDMQLFVHRNEPNRPHISSDTRDFKERETKQTEMRRVLTGAPRL
jgi:hypothetical protein